MTFLTYFQISKYKQKINVVFGDGYYPADENTALLFTVEMFEYLCIFQTTSQRRRLSDPQPLVHVSLTTTHPTGESNSLCVNLMTQLALENYVQKLKFNFCLFEVDNYHIQA